MVFFRSSFSRPAPSFHQVTFSRGFVNNARFARGGTEVDYSASWNGKPSHLFRANTASPEAKDLSMGTAWLAGVSPAGDLALFKSSKDSGGMEFNVVPARGGERHIVSDHVKGADWGPRGELCLLTEKDSVYSIEYPAGHKLYTSNNWIDWVRVAPSGDNVAFLEHPIAEDDAGQVVVVNSRGEARVLSSGWGSISGLAWYPSGAEIWFTAAPAGVDRVLMAVDLKKHVRQIVQIPGGLQLMDINSSGTVLIARMTPEMTMLLGKANEAVRNISLLDWSRAVAITPDGKHILFDESGEGGGKLYSVYLYNTDTGTSERVGEGRAMDISRDGRWVLTQAADDASKLFLVSVNNKEPKLVSNHGLQYRWAKFIPDSECQEILFEGTMAQAKPQIYRQELPSGNPVVLKEGLRMWDAIVDESGHVAAGVDADSGIVIVDLVRGTTRSLAIKKHVPIAFANSREVITGYRDKGAVLLDVVDLETGRLRNAKTVKFAEAAGTADIFPIHVSRDLETFVYSRLNLLSNLYTVSGWK
jgi:hypothetical protein